MFKAACLSVSTYNTYEGLSVEMWKSSKQFRGEGGGGANLGCQYNTISLELYVPVYVGSYIPINQKLSQ